MKSVDTDVLIAGAGPVGLSLAIELTSRGIGCRLVERNERIGMAPRAKTTNVRTRTHLRRWGIADMLADASPFGVDYPSNVNFVTRLGGKLLCRMENAFNCAPARNPLYPEHGQWIPQYKLEQVLRRHLDTLPGGRLELSTELLSARQTEDHIEARIRAAGSDREEVVTARYLVGADGASSKVRKLLGIKMAGTYGLSQNYNIVFHAPGLADRHDHGPGTMYWQVNDDAPGLIGPMDEEDVWFFMPTRMQSDVDLSDEEAIDLIRRSTGIDLPYRILSSDRWVASRLIADRYREGRIFLAGDACHLHPPFGGYGMNMGVSDAVDLGWKLAACLQGWGGAALLDSYEAERRPVHDAVMDEAVANHTVLANDLLRDGLDDDDTVGARAREEVGAIIVAAKRREFYTLGTVLGACYIGSPVIADEPEQAGSQQGEIYEPSSQPGCLAPHMWFDDGSSLYDHFGQGFALLVGQGAGAPQIDLFRDEARQLGIALEIIPIAERAAAAQLYPELFTLVRPDQHVAWRGREWQRGIFDRITGRINAD